jgi:hypothetical protein
LEKQTPSRTIGLGEYRKRTRDAGTVHRGKAADKISNFGAVRFPFAGIREKRYLVERPAAVRFMAVKRIGMAVKDLADPRGPGPRHAEKQRQSMIHKLTYAVSALRPHEVTMKTALSELDRQSDCSCFVMQPKFIFLRGLFYAAWMNET